MIHVFAILKANAQLFSTSQVGNSLSSDQRIVSDTSSKKQITTDDKIKINYFTKADTSKKNLDTGIALLHRNQLLLPWQMDLGNLGSAANNLFFSPNMDAAINLGTNGAIPYIWKDENIKYYGTTRPYTNLYYRLASKQEQQIKLLHTQNITPQWNVAASYQKVGSPGYFKLQKTNHDNAFLNTHYTSTNLRYNLKAVLIYSKIQQDENKGILSEEYLVDKDYRDRRLVPVNGQTGYSTNRSATTNYYRSAHINLEQQYFVGKADSIYNTDSSEKIYQFKPIAGIKHRFYSLFDYYRLNDKYPDSTYNQLLATTKDSLTAKNFLTRYGNAFSLNGNVTIQQSILQAEAGYGIEVDKINNGIATKNTYINNYLFATIRKDATNNKSWFYTAGLKSYFTGNAIGNSALNILMGKNLNLNSNVFLGLSTTLQSASYIQQNYASNYFRYSTDLKKQSISKIFLTYHNDTYHFQSSINYYTLGNYIYYNPSSLLAQQYGKVIPLIQLQLQKEFVLKQFHLYNEIWIQTLTDNPAIHLPLLMNRHIVFYQNKILKKKLQIATGIEGKYNSGYLADSYNPYLYSFVSQNTRKIYNFLQLSYFFNFKVKRFRASVSFDELQTFFVKNNINYEGYPATNFCMRFGFYWSFIN